MWIEGRRCCQITLSLSPGNLSKSVDPLTLPYQWLCCIYFLHVHTDGPNICRLLCGNSLFLSVCADLRLLQARTRRLYTRTLTKQCDKQLGMGGRGVVWAHGQLWLYRPRDPGGGHCWAGLASCPPLRRRQQLESKPRPPTPSNTPARNTPTANKRSKHGSWQPWIKAWPRPKRKHWKSKSLKHTNASNTPNAVKKKNQRHLNFSHDHCQWSLTRPPWEGPDMRNPQKHVSQSCQKEQTHPKPHSSTTYTHSKGGYLSCQTHHH